LNWLLDITHSTISG